MLAVDRFIEGNGKSFFAVSTSYNEHVGQELCHEDKELDSLNGIITDEDFFRSSPKDTNNTGFRTFTIS